MTNKLACVSVFAGALRASGLAMAADGKVAAVPQPPAATTDATVGFHLAITAMSLFLLVTLGVLLRALKSNPNWSVADAMSEEAGNQPATLPPGMKPLMVASASRTIAVFGLFVIVASFVGIAYWIVWALFFNGSLDALQKITPFFLSSAAIFAPYAVNQIKEAFMAFTSGAQPPPPIIPAATVTNLVATNPIVVELRDARTDSPNTALK